MDQNPNPQDTNNNIFEQNEAQPFARRTVSWAFNLGLIVLVMGLFAGWYFTASNEPDAAADPQMPGNQYGDNSVQGSIYDFFYGIFSGIGDDNAPLQGEAAANVSTMPVRGADSAGSANGSVAVQNSSILVPSTNGVEVEPVQNDNMSPEMAPAYFNGKTLDDEGRVAGDIKALIRNEEGDRIIYFTLDQSLSPADKPRDYHISYDEVEIAGEEGARFIRLNKEQTEALAQSLYESDEEAGQPETQNPER